MLLSALGLGIVLADPQFTAIFSPDETSAVYQTYGSVDAEADKGSGNSTWVESYAHVSGESGQLKSAFAGIFDGNDILGTITDGTEPYTFQYAFYGRVEGSVWVENHYLLTGTAYLATNESEVSFDTLQTMPLMNDDEARIQNEAQGDTSYAEVSDSGQTEPDVINQFSVHYRLRSYAFAGTNRPELEVFSSCPADCEASGWMEGYDASGKVGITIYFS